MRYPRTSRNLDARAALASRARLSNSPGMTGWASRIVRVQQILPLCAFGVAIAVAIALVVCRTIHASLVDGIEHNTNYILALQLLARPLSDIRWCRACSNNQKNPVS